MTCQIIDREIFLSVMIQDVGIEIGYEFCSLLVMHIFFWSMSVIFEWIFSKQFSHSFATLTDGVQLCLEPKKRGPHTIAAGQ